MDTSGFITRAYQEEIFNSARCQNIIAALDTGSGKTYIAALLIRWLAAQYTGTSHKIYVFLVPRVPLVEQQKDFISEQIPLTVRGYHGAVVDPWQHDPVRWAQEFNECDVMVMTAQVFLDAMLHAHWSMDQVALLVFDEAHHARKNHPYNQILQDFYVTCEPQRRPKVFGLTASPIWNPNNPHRSLLELEHNMHAKVVSVQENREELLEYSPRPKEILLEYPLQTSYPTYPLSLWERLVALDLLSHFTMVQENPEARYDVTRREIGPYGADFYLFSHLARITSDRARKYQYEYLTQDNLRATSESIIDGSQDLGPSSIDVDGIVLSSKFAGLETTLDRFRQSVSFDESFAPESEWLSPKLKVLVSILVERRSSSFQGIVFVEQRQVAVTLAWILPRIPELKGWIVPGALVGHGSGRGTGGSLVSALGMAEKKQRGLLKAFRDGSCNLLISTSVGEEGLDFQACDLIVRYDLLHNLVGYLQSRGRARHHDSTYIVMVPEGSFEEKMRYEGLRQSEPELRLLYQQRGSTGSTRTGDIKEPDDPVDLAARERYEVPSTGAVLTFGSAISLLNNLCALVPRDKYTKVLQPRYSGENVSTVELPSALPIPKDRLVYVGAIRRRKREAKAAAAFVACKALHALGVFDDYLLPARKTSGAIIEDADGRSIPEVGHVSDMMDVLVRDPWMAWRLPEENVIGPDAWVHPVLLGGRPEAYMGIVSASPLDFTTHFTCEMGYVQVNPPTQLHWPSGNELNLLHKYTALGLHWCNTSKSIKSALTCFFVPIHADGQPNFEVIREAAECPTRRNSADIAHEHENRLLLQNKFWFGRPLILRRLRDDLTPLSRPSLFDKQDTSEDFETYVELFESLYGRGKSPVFIPREGSMLLVESFSRNFSSRYPLRAVPTLEIGSRPTLKKQTLLPAGLCETFVLPEQVFQAYRVLPLIIRRITDTYRARQAIEGLGLSPLDEDLVVEALTLPCATAGYNNQRLETLGDSVLKLSVVVYLYNKYPYRHEGQLDGMRKNSVSNRVLLARAKEIGLERYLTSEASDVKKWRPLAGDGTFVDGVWYAKRNFARRSLQDCMEAILGVSFLTGGINMALHTGTALQLCFGGPEPWSTKYPPPKQLPVPDLFKSLQWDIGYEFRCGQLMLEAVTHPSFHSDNSCYQRLEFLGDALLDLVVMEFLYKKFPDATSGQLSWARSRAVCAPALATIAVKRLSLHRYLLANNVALGKAITKAVNVHSQLSYEDIVTEGWKYDPPKALSDLVESVCGAVLVDSGYDYECAKAVVKNVMEPLLEILAPNLPRDPTSELMMSLARRGCQRAKFERFSSCPEKNTQSDSIRFKVHGVVVGSPLRSPPGGLSRAKPLLAQIVLKQLDNPNSDFYLKRMCHCNTSKQGSKTSLASIPDDVDKEDLNDETEEEFAVLAILELIEADGVLDVIADFDEEEEDEEEEDVERMITD